MGNLQTKFESEIAQLLVDELSDYEISLDRAKQIARYILTNLPDNISDDNLRKLLINIDKQFIEISKVILKYLNIIDEQKNQQEIRDLADALGNKIHNFFIEKV